MNLTQQQQQQQKDFPELWALAFCGSKSGQEGEKSCLVIKQQ